MSQLVPARDTDAEGVAECLRLNSRSYIAPLSNRVVTGSDEELLLVEIQHRRYMVSISVSSHVHVVFNNE